MSGQFLGCEAESAKERIAELEAENRQLRAVVDAADKYDRCKGSYPALRLALNRWRKAEKARQPESGAEKGAKGE
jgi:hypothetical protein